MFLCVSSNVAQKTLEYRKNKSWNIFFGGGATVLSDTGPQEEIIRTSVGFSFHVAHICTFFFNVD